MIIEHASPALVCCPKLWKRDVTLKQRRISTSWAVFFLLTFVSGLSVAQNGAPPAMPTNTKSVKVNVVDVSEKFFKLTIDESNNLYSRAETTEAKPGDLIELEITAVNSSDVSLNNIDITNSIVSGPVDFVSGSIRTDEASSLFRVSRNGTDYFPADAQKSLPTVSHIQWVIFSLEPNEQIKLYYRVKIRR